MKVNKAKVAVTSLAIAAVAAMVGSISGTVAWFQYSTRASAAYTAATAHATESIQIRVADGEWKSALEFDDIRNFITEARGSSDTALRPVTTGAQKKDGRLNKLYKSPIYQYASMTTWQEADVMDYVQIPLELRALDIDGKATETTLSKEVYLTKMQMEQPNADTDHKDISNALRVHLDSNQNDNDFLVSKTGESVDVAGKLDLNGNDRDDRTEGWDGFNEEREYVHYGINPAQYRGEAADQTKLLERWADVKENDMYTDGTTDFIRRGNAWVDVTADPAFTDEYDDDDAAFAALCIPAAGSIYSPDGTNFFKYGASDWETIGATSNKGTYADEDAAKIALGRANMVNGNVYKNSTDNKFYAWQGGAFVNVESLAAYKGAYADANAANLAIAKEGLAANAVYYSTASTGFFVWNGTAWAAIESVKLGDYANDAAASAAHADEDLTGKIYKVEGGTTYKQHNGTAWVALDSSVNNYASDDEAILGLGAAPSAGDYYKLSDNSKLFKYNAGAWVDTTAASYANHDAAIVGIGFTTPFVAGDYFTVEGSTVINMYNGTAFVPVKTAANGLEARKAFDPVDDGTIYRTTAGVYKICKDNAWEDAYNISTINGEDYASAELALFAMNQNRYATQSTEKKFVADDVYFNTTSNKYEKLFVDGDGNFAWGTSAIQAHSYQMNHKDITADDSDPRLIKEGKVLGKTVVQVANEAELNALTNKAEGDLAYRADNNLQYVYEGGAWKANVDETVSTAAGFTDDSKVYYLDTAGGGYEIGMYENIDGEWVERNGENLRITVTIYLEGWQKLDGSAIWNDEDYVGAQFNVGLRFSGEAHVDHK